MNDFFEMLGISLAPMAAGFFGGIASLTFIPKVTPKAAITAILGGTAAAAYVTPLVVNLTGMTAGLENALAFLIGCMGMNIIGGLFSVSQRFKKDPISTVKSIKGSKDTKKE